MYVQQFGFRDQVAGILHPATSISSSPIGVVMCQPAERDYVRAHAACRELANRLATLGLPTLRFDYSGSGDSGADPMTVDLDTWYRDTRAAIDMLKHVTRVHRVVVIGCRLGALVAASAARYSADVHALVLWDPVVRGADYLSSQRHVQSSALVDRRRFRKPRLDIESYETLGFIRGPAMTLALEAADLTALDLDHPDVVVTAGWRDGARLRERVPSASWTEVRDDPGWSDYRRLDEPIRCAATIPALVRAVKRACERES